MTYQDGYEWAYLPWLAVANSFVMDYLARKKIALTMSYNVLDSLPFPRLELDDSRVAWLAPRVLALTCTSVEMTDYWNAMAHHGWCTPVEPGATPPGLIDPQERESARAELDAYVALNLFDLRQRELSAVTRDLLMLSYNLSRDLLTHKLEFRDSESKFKPCHQFHVTEL